MSPGIPLVLLALLVVAGVLYVAYRFVFRLPSDQQKKIEDASGDDEKDT